jgi:hypothetical protein
MPTSLPSQKAVTSVTDETAAEFRRSILAVAYPKDWLNISPGLNSRIQLLTYWKKHLSELTSIKDVNNFVRQRTTETHNLRWPLAHDCFKVLILRPPHAIDNPRETPASRQCFLMGQQQEGSICRTKLIDVTTVTVQGNATAFKKLYRNVNRYQPRDAYPEEVFMLCYQKKVSKTDREGGKGSTELICIGALDGITQDEKQAFHAESAQHR